MHRNLSLKLKEEIFEETEKIIKKNKIPRNRYINIAVDYFNRLQKRKALKEKLKEESRLVSRESLSVLKEFESLKD